MSVRSLPSPVARAVCRALLAGFVSALAAGLLVAGCRGTADKPDPEPRYRNFGPKQDFPEYFAGTVLETVDVAGIEPAIISGYGLVANLENTGRDDGIPSKVRESVMRTAVARGVGSELTSGVMGDLSAARLLADPRTSIVRVDAIVPPGARPGQRVDVRVTALETNTTVSLARGELYRTELHAGRVTPLNPGERVNLVGQARGRLSVNPVYALEDPLQVKTDTAAQASLRTAYIQDGGIFDSSRVIILRVREPSWRVARGVEERINRHFGAPVAAAQDEGVVHLAIPEKFGKDWAHFVGVATTLYFFGINKEFAVERAEALAKVAQDPRLEPAKLEGISYAWEGLGPVAAPTILPLLSDPNPAIAFWAARAAAFNEEQAAVDTLVRLAGEPQNPFAVAAAETLGKLKSNSGLIQKVRRLLDVSAPDVRIAAYQSLLRLGDRAIMSTAVGDKDLGKQFYVDEVPSNGPPLIWASRKGTPRIAIIGARPGLRPPMLATAFGDRLSINLPAPGQPATIYYRPVNDFNSSLTIFPDIIELIATLGGETVPGNVPIRLCYGDVLAVVKQMSDDAQIVEGGRAVPMILQDVAAELINDAPSIPGLESMQTADTAPSPQGQSAAGAVPAVSGKPAAQPGVSAARD